MNQSKIHDPRFWKKWGESGAVIDPQDIFSSNYDATMRYLNSAKQHHKNKILAFLQAADLDIVGIDIQKIENNLTSLSTLFATSHIASSKYYDNNFGSYH